MHHANVMKYITTLPEKKLRDFNFTIIRNILQLTIIYNILQLTTIHNILHLTIYNYNYT